MKKVLSIVLSFALVFGLLIGVQVKPVKVEGAVESMYFEATPKLDRVKLNWYKEKKVSKFIIYRADVTKLVKKGKVKLSKKKYKKIKTVSKKKQKYTDKKVKVNHYYAYYVNAYKKKKGKNKLVATSYSKYFLEVCVGVDKPSLRLNSYENEYDPEKCIIFDIVSGEGVKTSKFIVYRKGPGEKDFKKVDVEIKPSSHGEGDTYWCFDKNVEAKKAYQYKAKAYIAKGGKKIISKFSNVINQEAWEFSNWMDKYKF